MCEGNYAVYDENYNVGYVFKNWCIVFCVGTEENLNAVGVIKSADITLGDKILVVCRKTRRIYESILSLEETLILLNQI